jgi:two-component system OmpR family response regulator
LIKAAYRPERDAQALLALAGWCNRFSPVVGVDPPDGLVLDINMPLVDGFQVLVHLMSTGAIQRTPTLVLTARNQPEDVRRAIALGARDFISKPFKDDQLIARVARLVRKKTP